MLRLGSAVGRWTLVATVLASGMAQLDATVVNVALPTIGRDLQAGFAGLQWTVNAYTLTLAAFILLGGTLGDRYGRRRVFLIGMVWFAVASLACALAPDVAALAGLRALQGIGAALLTPGSLAILQSSFAPADRGAAIGAWSALGGVAGAVGPFVGGWLVTAASWRWVFAINLPLAAVAVAVTVRQVPESRNPGGAGRPDLLGAGLAAAGLGGLTGGLLTWSGRWPSAGPLVLLAAGLALLAAFLPVERRRRYPMLPPGIFGSGQFRATNAVTLCVYAALGAAMLLLGVQLQDSLGYSPLAAGSALLPVTACLLLLSRRIGALSARLGPRRFLTAGPLLAGAGVALLSRVRPGSGYPGGVLPGVLLLGIGLGLTVAPLTATVLAAAPAEHAGAASGVNNAVARVAGLLAIAAVPLVSGLVGADYRHPAALTAAWSRAALLCAGLLCAGGLLAALTVSDLVGDGPPPGDPDPAAAAPAAG